MIDPTPEEQELIMARTAELLGGTTVLDSLIAIEFAELKRRWFLQTEEIGRILRAHLFVERYMNDYIAQTYPNIDVLEKARLTFSQKTHLLNPSAFDISRVLPGIRVLNAIRNSIAHHGIIKINDDQLRILAKECRGVVITPDDAEPASGKKAMTTVELIETFAQNAAQALLRAERKDPLSKAIWQSIDEHYRRKTNAA